MHFIQVSAWDKGDYYAVNQDSFAVQAVLTGSGPYAMAIICDGVGSLAKGEYASGVTVREMTDWFYECGLPLLYRDVLGDKLLRSCRRALQSVHNQLIAESDSQGILMGTTFSMVILSARKYYSFQVGDGSCFKVSGKTKNIGKRQVNERGELTGAIGVGELPDIIFQRGRYGRRDRFILCSDGFERCLTRQALISLGNRKAEETAIRKLIYEIICRGRRKGERDNCTVIVIGRK